MPRRKVPSWLKAARALPADQDRERPENSRLDWISRALSRAGVLPVLQAEEAMRAGRVRLDSRVVREPFTPCTPRSKVELDGRVVDVTPRTLVLAFHKPKGLVVSTRDDEGLGTVFDALDKLLPPELRGYGWMAVGRLDRDTTGTLLFTNDERFVEHATSPASHLPKRYVVTVSGVVTQEKLAALRAGVEWDGLRSRPASATQRGPHTLELVLTEGKHHQVKRMVNAVSLGTLSLHREAVGSYELDVPEGAMRRLTDEEIAAKLEYEPR